VADDDGRIVGHILFSALPIRGERGEAAAALAPMAVVPERQRAGVGTQLITAGIAACRARDIAAIVVLRHEPYYPRFDFSAEAARRLDSPFSGPTFMALALRDDAPLAGRARYPRAFFVLDG